MLSLPDLIGDWRLCRDIAHGDGSSARFDGTARWQFQGQGAAYLEQGWLVMDKARFAAERRYYWDDRLRVFFEDGRFFHQVPASGGETEHWCDPDSYHVRYAFEKWPDWSAIWSVHGPKKNYVMTSHYSPV